MTLPNFLIIGAAKAGTTALHYYLRQHPQIYMSRDKETNFFAFEGQEVRFYGPGDEQISQSAITTLETYEDQFAAATNEIAVGEASPWYLYCPQAAKNIHRHLPDAKLIAILRNPADRAFSSYLHVVRDGRESLSFQAGLCAEEERIEQGWEFIWHYQRTGYYSAQVERFLELFPRDQMRVYLYDDLLLDPAKFLKDICEFLGVDTRFSIDTSLRPNATGVPKNRLLGRLLLQPNLFKSTIKLFTPDQLRYNLGLRVKQSLLIRPRPDQEIRSKLLSQYKADISTLQDIIGRDLTVWTEEQPQLHH